MRNEPPSRSLAAKVGPACVRLCGSPPIWRLKVVLFAFDLVLETGGRQRGVGRARSGPSPGPFPSRRKEAESGENKAGPIVLQAGFALTTSCPTPRTSRLFRWAPSHALNLSLSCQSSVAPFKVWWAWPTQTCHQAVTQALYSSYWTQQRCPLHLMERGAHSPLC